MEGYPQIAQVMGDHGELAIFRRFNFLNRQSLLLMQAELVHLESDLQALAERDKSCPECPNRSRDWWSLTQFDSKGNREQWDKVLQIREKLKEYS